RGGLGAIGELCRRYSRHHRRHPDVLPIVALDLDSYQHKIKDYGRIKFPKFTAMGWAPKSKFDDALIAAGFTVSESEPAEPQQSTADELSDELLNGQGRGDPIASAPTLEALKHEHHRHGRPIRQCPLA